MSTSVRQPDTKSGQKIPMDSIIPVVDFSAFALDKTQVKDEDLKKLATEIREVFSNVGFMYIKNHGIPSDIIKAAEKARDDFFTLKDEQKVKYHKNRETRHGWGRMGAESLDPKRPGDYKETYDVTPTVAQSWPNEDVHNFKEAIMTFFKHCDDLALRMLEVIAVGLGLPRKFFKDHHNTFTKPNHTTLRLLHYPALQDGSDIKKKQLRCGEHSDYGSITLLFQDDVGGLEVFSRDGFYVSATPIEGTIIVNIADLMQRWTSDKLKSTKHRVPIPEDEAKRMRSRNSMAYFVNADDDHLVTCCDGSNKYPPITTQDYLKMKFDETH